MYRVDADVLDKLDELATTYARPFEQQTDAHHQWIEEAVNLLIRRLGDYASDPGRLTQITMNDLPEAPRDAAHCETVG
jgi:hypothetical protein